MTCKKLVKFQKTQICTKDLKKRITIQYPFNVGTSNAGANTTRSFKDVVVVWAAVKTTPTGQFFEGINIEEAITTDFYIRFTSLVDLGKQIWVLFNGKRFKIANVENINEDNRYFRLRAIERGITAQEANKI